MFHVKHDDSQPRVDADRIQAVLNSWGLTVTSREAALLSVHAGMVLDANTRMNLTRITLPESVITLHILDSLAFLGQIDPIEGLVLDIGSGAGYPGLPLAVMGYDCALCESVKKKAGFLAECVEALGLDVPVYALRAEELAEQCGACADVVVCRAVSALPSLVELAAPLLEMGGRLVALKGSLTSEERSAGMRAAQMCGMSLAGETAYELPGDTRREVVVFERTHAPSIALPRRPGMAQNHPLG
jgi:16S rRNA (guanine527-N7)-methyltransferase